MWSKNVYFLTQNHFLKPPNLFLQQFTGKMYTAFNGAQRFAKHVCYFVVLKPIKIQHKRYFKNARQLINNFLNIFMVNITDSIVYGNSLRGI
jgi:hypothetical protein